MNLRRYAVAFAFPLLLLPLLMAPAGAQSPNEVEGRVLRPDGSAADGAFVAADPEEGTFERIAPLIGSLVLAGFPCLYEPFLVTLGFDSGCFNEENTPVTRADGVGHYRLPLVAFRPDRTYFLRVSLPAASGERTGAALRLSYKGPGGLNPAADLHLWGPGAAFTGSALSWAPYEHHDGDIEYRLTVGQAGGVLFQQRGEGTTVALDPRAIEDTVITAALHAETESLDPNQNRRFDLLLDAPTLDIAGTAGPPVSRGAGCAIALADGTIASPAPCPLTDGNLVTAIDQAAPAVAGAAEAVVDLGAVHPIALVVCAACSFDVSVDGTVWRPTVTTEDAALTAGFPGARQPVPVAVPARGRFVRVRSSTFGITPEVSVWAGDPLAWSRTDLPGIAEVGIDVDDEDDASLLVPGVVALAALVAATGLLVAARGRRTIGLAAAAAGTLVAIVVPLGALTTGDDSPPDPVARAAAGLDLREGDCFDAPAAEVPCTGPHAGRVLVALRGEEGPSNEVLLAAGKACAQRLGEPYATAAAELIVQSLAPADPELRMNNDPDVICGVSV